MKHIPPMVDMAREPEDDDDPVAVTVPMKRSHQPTYPYGLCITLETPELEKLDLDMADVDVGDTIHLFAFAKVTSKSSREMEGGEPCCRIELQITNIASENEDEENEEEYKKEPVVKRLYG